MFRSGCSKGGKIIEPIGSCVTSPRPFRLILAGAICAAACVAAADADQQAADLVMTGAAVYTLVPGHEWAEAVAVAGGQIRYVGDAAGARDWIGPATTVLDLHGRMVLPGFQDAHVHPLSAGLEHLQCPLFGMTTARQYIAAVTACAREQPDRPWIIGGGWLVTAFPPEGIPDKALLDLAIPDRPVALVSTDGHSLWANSKAMQIAGIDHKTPDPPRGRIDRDARSGEPVGSFQETAAELIMAHAPPPAEAELDRALAWALAHLNGLGITAWQDASVSVASGDPMRSLATYRRLDQSGKLNAHVILSLLWDNGLGLEQMERLRAARTQYNGGGIAANTVKIFVDGVVEVQTAALLQDYSDRPGYAGELQIATDLLDQALIRLDADGFQVHLHAIGDRAVRTALNAIAAARRVNGPNDLRHHIAHVQMIHAHDLPRFAALGVTANFQPLWAFADDYITDLTLPRIGPERTPSVYPIASVVHWGGRIAFGSDWSVSSANPLEGIEVAVTRMGPNGETDHPFLPAERIPLAEAIAAYTAGAARVNRLDTQTGTLEAGKLADLIVLDRNLFKIDPREISDAKVLLTLFGGRIAHGSFAQATAP